MRLSKRGWNNVIIFAMLVMIILFNLSDIFKSEQASLEAVPLLPEHALVMSIEYADWKVERIGQSWRRSPGTTDTNDLSALAASWQSAMVQALPAEPTLTDASPMVAVVWLAGEAQGRVYEFYRQGESTLLRHDQTWYQLISPNLELLINA